MCPPEAHEWHYDLRQAIRQFGRPPEKVFLPRAEEGGQGGQDSSLVCENVVILTSISLQCDVIPELNLAKWRPVIYI